MGGSLFAVLRVRPHGLRTRWSFAPGGPLAYLTGRKPLASTGLTDMAISFGLRTKRS
jgi:hypothetical protein